MNNFLVFSTTFKKIITINLNGQGDHKSHITIKRHLYRKLKISIVHYDHNKPSDDLPLLRLQINLWLKR